MANDLHDLRSPISPPDRGPQLSPVELVEALIPRFDSTTPSARVLTPTFELAVAAGRTRHIRGGRSAGRARSPSGSGHLR